MCHNLFFGLVIFKMLDKSNNTNLHACLTRFAAALSHLSQIKYLNIKEGDVSATVFIFKVPWVGNQQVVNYSY